MYDQTKQDTYTGKLVRFIPGANHAQLLFEIVDAEGKLQVGADGKPITWGVEFGPAATIAKQGVTVEAFPIGTVITVTLNPLRNGKSFGAMAQGARLIAAAACSAGGCTAETGKLFLDRATDSRHSWPNVDAAQERGSRLFLPFRYGARARRAARFRAPSTACMLLASAVLQ